MMHPRSHAQDVVGLESECQQYDCSDQALIHCHLLRKGLASDEPQRVIILSKFPKHDAVSIPFIQHYGDFARLILECIKHRQGRCNICVWLLIQLQYRSSDVRMPQCGNMQTFLTTQQSGHPNWGQRKPRGFQATRKFTLLDSIQKLYCSK